MSSKITRGLAVAALAVGVGAAALPAAALTLKVSITNTGGGGLTLTPLLTAFHDGSFDTFDVGAAASAGLELIAEEGDPSGILGSAAAHGGVATGVITAPGGFPGAPVIENGETGSIMVNVDGASQRFFSYLSMILPSNDQFIGNGDPMAHALFDAAGRFLGPQTIAVTGLNTYDAGTEANTATGAPFVPGLDPTAVVEGGTVTLAPGNANFDGIALANGQIFDSSLADYAGNGGYQIASISVTAVPVPAALPLLGGAVLMMGAVARRRRKTGA